MKFFLDTANIEEIRQGVSLGLVDGITTNPSLIAKEGRNLEEVAKEICELVDGPVSLEVVSTNAAEIIEETRGMPLDASAPKRFQTSKIIIDATRQFSEEGGPNIWPEISKVMLEKLSPETFDLIEQNWENYFIHWKR